MSPEERQLLTGLFDRIRGAAATPRDPEAEALISDNVRSMPFAPYLLAQAVIVQDQALQAANTKIQELEAQLREAGQQQQAPGQGGFLSGLGSIFGGGQPQRQAPPPPPPQGSPWGQQQYAPPQGGPGGPWGAGPEGPMGGPMGGPQMGGPMGGPGGFMGGGQPGGGGFLKGALGAAAGVAGGVLLADSIRGLFGQHNNPLGMATGFSPGAAGATGAGTGGETVINNYYDGNQNQSPDSIDYGSSSDSPQNDSYDVSDDSSGDFGSDNDSYDV